MVGVSLIGGVGRYKMRQLMNQNPTWRTQFVDYVVQYRDRLMGRLVAQVDAICNQIAPAMAMDSNPTSSFEDFRADCVAVQKRIDERVVALRRLLKR